MGAFLDKPKTDKYSEQGLGNGLSYAVSSMQGWRVEMEDAHCARLGLADGLKDWSFFAVFDGHAGARCSAHCAQHLLESIMQSDEFRSSAGLCCGGGATDGDQDAGGSDDGRSAVDTIKRSIRDGFLRLDEKMRSMPEMMSGEDKSGSTAVCTLVSPRHLIVANCGDSRAVMSRNRRIAFCTQDHKPNNPEEKERIQNAGGSVMIQRVNGSLAVSRSLGDYEYKQVEGKGPCEQLVSPEPEVYVVDRDLDGDEFLVLACDGVWDVVSNDELCDFVRSRLEITDNLENVCNTVIDTCLFKGSRDNMSIVLVTFPGAPKVSQEAVNREAELEAVLEKKIKELCEKQQTSNSDGGCGERNFDFGQLMQSLSEEEIPNLPPGGGLSAKHGFIESVFNKLRPKTTDGDETENW